MLKFEQRASQNKCTAEKVKEIQKATGLRTPVAKLLCERGINTSQDAKRFLHPGVEQLHDPLLLPDMEASVSRIKQVVEMGEKITVFCDYDADGTCGGCALYLHLLSMGASVCIMTPNRHKEGYGLNPNAIEKIAAGGTKLIITVDCGITNVAETALANSRGIDVIITDHHECGQSLPNTPYIINPKRPDSEYPCAFIAGCGVAFKLIHALSSLACAMHYIDLVAIGTITDIVPLLDENRAIAYLGIKKMRKDPSAGIAALANEAGINLSAISSFGVSFGLGPRINAAGRMDTASVAIDILNATKTGSALMQRAAKLCQLNEQRKQEVENIFNSAQEMIHANEYMKEPAIVLAGDTWNTGVIGIAAARITEKYHRPCVLFGGSEGNLAGSARSIDGINMFETLGAFSDRYEKFGGHAQAAGLTIQPSVLDGLRSDVCDYIRTHYDESVFVHKKVYDMVMDIGDITHDFVEDIGMLEPFGQSNAMPNIAVFDADMVAPKFIGKNTKPHLKFVMQKNGAGIEAIRFFFKTAHSFASKRSDFLCQASINDYNNKPQLIVRDIAFKYDKMIVESFIKTNKKHMMERFIAEVVDFSKNDYKAMNESAFSQTISKEIDKSRFGLCIIANTQPALKRLIQMGAIHDALSRGTLSFYDEIAFSTDNCIACGSPSGHDRMYGIGISDNEAFLDDRLLADYRQHAAQYFAEREKLLDIYRRICSFAVKKPRTQEEISRCLGLNVEKTIFAQQVFLELELIQTDKSGRILALKKSGQKKSLRQSQCYRCFEDFLNRG